MFTKIYYWFHSLTSDSKERGEYSSGHWQAMIRRQALNSSKGIEGNVLEVGCGEGLFLVRLAREKPKLNIYGIDNNISRLSEAESKIKKNEINNVNLSCQQAEKMSFSDEYFDAVFCINVFFNMNSLEDVKKALREVSRVLKPSGKFIFDFRNKRNLLLKIKYSLAKFYDPTVKNLALKTYTIEEINEALMQAKFKSNKLIPLGFPKNNLAPIFVVSAQKAS